MKKVVFILKKIITITKFLLIIIPILLIVDKINGGKYLYPYIAKVIKTSPAPEVSNSLEITSEPELSSTFTPEQSPSSALETTEKKLYVGSLPNPNVTLNTGRFYTAAFWKTATLADVRTELENGADANARNSNGQTILMYASAIVANPKIIEMLYMYGAAPSSRDNAGRTALMFAAALNRNPDIIDRLISIGANISEKDQNGWSPLHYAAAHNSNHQIIHILLQHGADINMPIAEKEQNWKHASLDNQFLEITKIGLKHAERLITNLYLSLGSESKNSYTEIFNKQLDEMAAEIHSPEAGQTPLMLAARTGSPEVIMFLLQHGANIRLRDTKGKTAVDHAKENPQLYKTDIYWQMNDKLYN